MSLLCCLQVGDPVCYVLAGPRMVLSAVSLRQKKKKKENELRKACMLTQPVFVAS